ncbi:MAG: hypothetical protein KC535_02830 [Nanoarchaeota archaeon]|nr:hypothetical protein [Nanoarchaeota archaeon]
MKSTTDKLRNYFSDSYLERTINELEEISIEAATAESHPYSLLFTSQDNRFKIANILTLVEDEIVLPLVSSLSDNPLIRPKRKYHLHQQSWGTHVVPARRRKKVVSRNLPEQAIEKMRGDLSQKFDEFKQDDDRAMMFRSKIASQEFIGINLNQLVWSQVGFQFYNVLAERIRQKFLQLPKSSYFSQFNKEISYLGEGGPSVFYGADDKDIIAFGKELGKGKEENYSRKVQYIDLESIGYKRAVSHIVEEGKKNVLSVIEQAIKEDDESFSLTDSVRNQIPFKFHGELLKWSLGAYFNQEGLFDNTYVRYALKEVDPREKLTEISESSLEEMGKQFVVIAEGLLDKFQKNKTELILDDDNYYDHNAIAYRPRHGLIGGGPRVYASLTNLGRFLKEHLSNKIKKELPIVSYADRKNAGQMVPYYCYSDRSGISWNKE